ncbi:MAG: MGMT family protein [Alphaproteobacteria bacterium]|nr:MGMT family protein [Alphaproteobacteria bacterium]
MIIPCHRVTKHDGSLGNYGAIRSLSPKDHRNLAIKAALIAHERQIIG